MIKSKLDITANNQNPWSPSPVRAGKVPFGYLHDTPRVFFMVL